MCPCRSLQDGHNGPRTLRGMAAEFQIVKPWYVGVHALRSKHEPVEELEDMAFCRPTDLVKQLPLTALMGRAGQEGAIRFWNHYRMHKPEHPIFLDVDCDLSMVFPYALHGDEGAGLAEARGDCSSDICSLFVLLGGCARCQHWCCHGSRSCASRMKAQHGASGTSSQSHLSANWGPVRMTRSCRRWLVSAAPRSMIVAGAEAGACSCFQGAATSSWVWKWN